MDQNTVHPGGCAQHISLPPHRRHETLWPAGVAAGLARLRSCASIGPRTATRDRFDYRGSISEWWKRQTLLNIVKARMREVAGTKISRTSTFCPL